MEVLIVIAVLGYVVWLVIRKSTGSSLLKEEWNKYTHFKKEMLEREKLLLDNAHWFGFGSNVKAKHITEEAITKRYKHLKALEDAGTPTKFGSMEVLESSYTNYIQMREEYDYWEQNVRHCVKEINHLQEKYRMSIDNGNITLFG